jgi:hypothetical protein
MQSCDPELESAWFQPLEPVTCNVISWFHKVCGQIQLVPLQRGVLAANERAAVRATAAGEWCRARRVLRCWRLVATAANARLAAAAAARECEMLAIASTAGGLSGAYHLLTLVRVVTPHLVGCFKASLLPLKRPR